MRLAALRAVVKEAALVGLGSRGIVSLKLRRLRASGALTILNLHRVAPHDRSAYPPLDPKLFDYLLAFAKRHFRLVTFGTAEEEPQDLRPRLILSFDDAYKDFIEVAVPLLDRHQVRVNQNVIPQSIETGLPPLNVLMQDFIGRAPWDVVRRLEIPGFDVAKWRSPAALGGPLSTFLKNRPMHDQDALREALLPQLRAYPEFLPTPMMSREEVREVGTVHELGAHSYSHASMGYETDDYLRDDVRRCRDYFSRELSLPLRIYALPNGSYRRSQIDILEQEQIEHILLVDEDFSAPRKRVHPRFTFDGASRHEVRFRAAGGWRWPSGAREAA